ncbi:MAG: hypothetical protein LBL74_06665, partial [Bacteroidales bacterium]|nr:hypothetical protein [Bacteroidales bacterium]
MKQLICCLGNKIKGFVSAKGNNNDCLPKDELLNLENRKGGMRFVEIVLKTHISQTIFKQNKSVNSAANLLIAFAVLSSGVSAQVFNNATPINAAVYEAKAPHSITNAKMLAYTNPNGTYNIIMDNHGFYVMKPIIMTAP